MGEIKKIGCFSLQGEISSLCRDLGCWLMLLLLLIDVGAESISALTNIQIN